MPEAEPPAPPALFDELLSFVEELREDYAFGADEFIAVQELLLALAARDALPDDPAGLEGYLAPILCSTRREQEGFGARYRNWLAQRAPEQPRVESPAMGPVPRWDALRRREFRINWFMGAIVAFAAALILAWAVNTRRVEKAGDAHTSASAQLDPTPVGSGSDPTPDPAPIPAPSPKPPAQPAVVKPLLAPLAALAALLVLVTTVLRRGVRRKQAEDFLSRGGQREVPDSETTLLRLRPLSLLSPRAVQRASALLRRRRPTAEEQLDVYATVRRTAENGGEFVEVRSRRTGVPEYLFLIERRSFHDLLTAKFEQLVDALANNGVHVIRYYFDHDPTVVFPRDPALSPVLLRELGARHPGHRLALFAELTTLIDPLSGRATPIVGTLLDWSAPVLFTPGRPAEIGPLGDVLRADGLRILPADPEGLLEAFGDGGRPAPNTEQAAYAPALPKLLSGDVRRWLAPEPPSETLVEQGLSELGRYLSAFGQHWLAACAMYPQLRWPLALELAGQLAPSGASDLAEDARRISRLPWSRAARMPDWLRQRLVRDLSPQQHRSAQQALERVLVEAAHSDADGPRLEVGRSDPALISSLFARLTAHWKNQDEELPSPAEDGVFLGAMRRGESISLPRVARALRSSVRERARSPLAPRELPDVLYGAFIAAFALPSLFGRGGPSIGLSLFIAMAWAWLGVPVAVRTPARAGFRSHVGVVLRGLAVCVAWLTGACLFGIAEHYSAPFLCALAAALVGSIYVATGTVGRKRTALLLGIPICLLLGVGSIFATEFVALVIFVLVPALALALHGAARLARSILRRIAPSLARAWVGLRVGFDRFAPDRLLFEPSVPPFAQWPRWVTRLCAASLGFAFGSSGYAVFTSTPSSNQAAVFGVLLLMLAALPHFAGGTYATAGLPEAMRRAAEEALLAALVALAVWQPGAKGIGLIAVLYLPNVAYAWLTIRPKLRVRDYASDSPRTDRENKPPFWWVAYGALFLAALAGPMPSAVQKALPSTLRGWLGLGDTSDFPQDLSEPRKAIEPDHGADAGHAIPDAASPSESDAGHPPGPGASASPVAGGPSAQAPDASQKPRVPPLSSSLAPKRSLQQPTVKMGATAVSGRLPQEVIQRIVRQNFSRFRTCYEQGLGRNPNLEGRVTARFVIGRDGAVSNASNGGSDLPDSAVVSCVVSAFYGLTFPEPEGGIVTVVYPIVFSPG
ncbi:MAG TPA: AgmX/PglI C-terminal domain-containing protein [Polyangiaceae bacterium]|nr:AgmX/PglI C-terminal domain-containing protein [Polyangiaceae bacterium]